MSFSIRFGKLFKRERLRKREPEREPIKTSYHHELWHNGSVRTMARAIAKQQFIRELQAKGKDVNQISDKEMENGITVLLFNSGEFYLNKAKEALR